MTTTANTTFTLSNGTIFVRQPNGYCFMTTPEGKRTRIGKADFNAAYVQFDEEQGREMSLVPEEEMEAAIAKVEESEQTEEGKKIAKAMKDGKKSTRKPRRVKGSETIAVETPNGTVEVSLTPKQIDFIRHLPDTNFWENGLDSAIWVDVLCDEIGGQFEGKPMTVGAMISTLCEKHLGMRSRNKVNGHMATSFQLSPMGQLVAAKLGVQ